MLAAHRHLVRHQVADVLRSIVYVAPYEAPSAVAQGEDLEAHAVWMYSTRMPSARDPFDREDHRLAVLALVLAGLGLLWFLGWLLTL